MAWVEVKEDEDKLRKVLGIVQKYGMDAETLCDVVIELDERFNHLTNILAKQAIARMASEEVRAMSSMKTAETSEDADE